ncbi:alpha/beta hydrolase [Streptomyces yaizuensis]|uniref:Alpha/beta hydrolase n=1 Tax=Streptomyces yaizuensis TaxID=2989713 RepID=A0ABQ5P990_9ACTN|nr:alpha/beta hydrolase [Streptomyces sp. YSPA8]GLF99122.1 alpha/beta hydrolase [Streptomyces sp. YSPA8]
MNTIMRVNPTTRRRTLSVLLALSASAGLALPGTALAQEPSRVTFSPPPISWGACPKAEPPYPDPSPRAECATVEVPVDWSKPDGPRTGIFVARQRATDPSKRIGVLLSNPGGPGSSGSDSAFYADDPVGGYGPAMLQRFDIVGFDPRGVGLSQGAQCDETISESIPTRPRNAAEFERLRTLNGRLAQSCIERTGPLAAHMDTESVARDMDAIRAALGERKISFLGHSYGTSVGERYARLFPDRLRALALDSAVDPEGAGAERYLTDASVTADKALKRLAAWCEKDPACALKGQDVIAVTDRLFARADAGTLLEPGPEGPTQTKVSADQLSGLLTRAFLRWNPEWAAEQLAALRSGTGQVLLSPDGPELTWQLVLCRDNDYRIRDWAHYRAMLDRVAKAAPHVRYNAQALDMILGCQGWSMPPKPRPDRATGALPPVLVVNAALDAATPLPGAQRMARAFPKSTLITVDTVGHWLYAGKDMKKVIDTYLMSRKG